MVWDGVRERSCWARWWDACKSWQGLRLFSKHVGKPWEEEYELTFVLKGLLKKKKKKMAKDTVWRRDCKEIR